MKKFLVFLFILCFGITLTAQKALTITDPNAGGGNGGSWQNAILRADGFTEINGVEAFCQKVSCDGEQFLLVKFVNKNEYRVKVEWIDAIYVNGTWFYSKNPNPSALYLEAKSETAGQCEAEGKLKVKIDAIIENPNDYGHYTVSGLVVK